MPRSNRDIFSPVVGLPKAEHLARLAIGQRRLELAKLAGDRDLGTIALEELAGRDRSGDGVVDGIEDLKAESILLDRQMHDFAKVAGVDIGPGVAFARRRIGHEARKLVVLMRL